MDMVTPSYIKSLLMPNGKSKSGRRVWGVDMETVWLPLLHATNVMGDTAIPNEALGAPIRLSYDKDGGVKFGKSGRPVTKVVKEISQTVTLIRENMVANLQDYTAQVADSKAKEYKASITSALKAGRPILENDKAELSKAVQAQLDEAMRKAEAEAEAEAPPEPEPEREKQAVHA